jgi:hypothetical protein
MIIKIKYRDGYDLKRNTKREPSVKINVLHFCPICKRDVLVGKNNIKTI